MFEPPFENFNKKNLKTMEQYRVKTFAEFNNERPSFWASSGEMDWLYGVHFSDLELYDDGFDSWSGELMIYDNEIESQWYLRPEHFTLILTNTTEDVE